MDLMKLLENWKQISGMNQPMLPGQPSQATPPFMPAPGQGGYQPQQAGSPFGSKIPQPEPAPQIPQPEPAPQGPMGPMGPMEVSGPPRHLAGELGVGPDQQMGPSKAELLGEVDVDAERRSGMVDKKWYKDGDFMNELGGRLSNAFGSMTLRGNTPGEEKANMLKIAQAGSNRKKNKTMDALIQSNPELAQKMLQLPPEMRDQYMQLAMKSSFAKADESSFAEQVRMFRQAHPSSTQAEALAFAKGNNGTNIDIDMGGGAGSFEDKLGEKTADWISGRRITSGQNRAEAGRVIERLEQAVAKGENVTGDWSSYLPDSARNLFNAEGLELQQDVERIVQQSLKETLGAQFAQKEAEQLFARTWNPKASPEVNLRRTRRLMDELDSYAGNMDGLTNGMIENGGSILKYLQTNPELAGAYTANTIYNIAYEDDFDTAGIMPEAAAPTAPRTGGIEMEGKTYYYNEATGKYETDE